MKGRDACGLCVSMCVARRELVGLWCVIPGCEGSCEWMTSMPFLSPPLNAQVVAFAW